MCYCPFYGRVRVDFSLHRNATFIINSRPKSRFSEPIMTNGQVSDPHYAGGGTYTPLTRHGDTATRGKTRLVTVLRTAE
jgi:hypothetical protein